MTSMLRTPLVLPVAGAVTVGLFLMMRGLIDIGPVEPEPEREPLQVEIRFDVTEVEVDPAVDMEIIPDVEAPPPVQRLDVPHGTPDEGFVDAVYEVRTIEPGEVEMSSTANLNRDGNPIPLIRIEPAYPDSASRRGLEGQCTMVFDITPEGMTANVRVLNCTNTAFERSSINAVMRWRYSPQVLDGMPTVYRGATTQLVYRMG